jgi:hypothetical protein
MQNQLTKNERRLKLTAQRVLELADELKLDRVILIATDAEGQRITATKGDLGDIEKHMNAISQVWDSNAKA